MSLWFPSARVAWASGPCVPEQTPARALACRRRIFRPTISLLPVLVVLGWLCAPPAPADVRVQDIARLQGERTNRLVGYGLVVGLKGTGDGDKNKPTMRALMQMHQRYQTPVLTDVELKGNASVALVAVEAEIPATGAREGQAIDITVSALGSAKSLEGGQLLPTPLQYAMFDEREPATQVIFALGGGRVELTDKKMPTRGRIRRGATLEADFFYSFIQDDAITLILDEGHTGWTWSQMLARAVNHELSQAAARGGTRVEVTSDFAIALSPSNVRVKIPAYEMRNPAGFISRVLQTGLFLLPEQDARVVINRTTKSIACTGAVRVSPVVLQVPGAGTLSIGLPEGGEAPAGAANAGGNPTPNDADGSNAGAPGSGGAGAARAAAGRTNEKPPGVEFRELLAKLNAVKLPPDQIIEAVEHLSRTGALHGRVIYEE